MTIGYCLNIEELFGIKQKKIACLYGDCDSMIDKIVIDKWQEYSTKEIWKKEFVGSHYYIEEQENLRSIESIINRVLRNIG